MVMAGDGQVPSRGKLDEDLRLLYVAVTRAKDQLFLVAPRYTTRGYGFSWSHQCPFLQALPVSLFEKQKASYRIYSR